jgi:carboxylesterase
MTLKLPRISKKGYDLPGDRAHALFFHGYTGSPYDLRVVSDFLSSHGIGVTVPLLAGHGTKPSDLFTTTARDWLRDATTALHELDKEQPIILGGLSMGALLAILLAAEFQNIRALVLFSPSLKLTSLAELTITSAKLGLLDKTTSLKKLSGGSDIADPVAKAKTPSYLEMPMFGLLEFEKLRIHALENIRNIPCPVFIAFGKNDGAINTLESHKLMVSNTRKPLVSKFYSRSKHVITLDYDRERLCSDLIRFFIDSCGLAL